VVDLAWGLEYKVPSICIHGIVDNLLISYYGVLKSAFTKRKDGE